MNGKGNVLFDLGDDYIGCFFFFFFFLRGLFVFHTTQLVGSQFPDQGLNSGRGIESPEC